MQVRKEFAYFVFQRTFKMGNSDKHLQDIAEIRQMMERSSRFISLSGWSGIFAGVFALIGVGVASFFIRSVDTQSMKISLIADALIVLFLALTSALFFSHRKARKQGTELWTPVTRRLLANMAIPLLTGGIYCAILLVQGQYHLLAGISLIFYGLALVNAGRFINKEAVLLGIMEITLGIAATIWYASGLWIWAVGFGLLHIVYGITLHYKYDRQQ